MTRRLLILTIFVHFKCSSGEDKSTPTTPTTTETATEISDTSESGISAFCAGNRYRDWTADASVHASDGPHGQVKTFFNNILKASIEANNSRHPVGSASVKELYSGDQISGYAVEVKISDTDGANSWVFYEDLNISNATVDFYGQGLSTCANCHSSGTDYVKDALP